MGPPWPGMASRLAAVQQGSSYEDSSTSSHATGNWPGTSRITRGGSGGEDRLDRIVAAMLAQRVDRIVQRRDERGDPLRLQPPVGHHREHPGNHGAYVRPPDVDGHVAAKAS